MLKQTHRFGTPLALAFGLVLMSSHVSAEIYSWRTEDGGIAYSDDRDQIPARYAKEAKRVGQPSLAQYKRFTPQDDAAHSDYAARLRERLTYLRKVNEEAPVAHRYGGSANYGGRTISVATGNARVPEIQLPVGGDNAGPIIVEPVNAKSVGDSRTRRVTVIRQGGKTVAVVKGSPVQHNPSQDIYDEEELEQGKF